MADEKKSAGGEGGGGNGFVDAIFWILLFFVLLSVGKYFLGAVHFNFALIPSFSKILSTVYNVGQVISIFLSMAFVLGIFYFRHELNNLHGHGGHGGHGGGHASHAGHDAALIGPEKLKAEPVKNKTWIKVEEKMRSPLESDWRLAILDCDIILNEMLDKMGYEGEGVAEKLKQIEPSDFTHLSEAWRAHKIRNEIAHSGSNYRLTKKDAEDAIGMYKKVFHEFFYI